MPPRKPDSEPSWFQKFIEIKANFHEEFDKELRRWSQKKLSIGIKKDGYEARVAVQLDPDVKAEDWRECWSDIKRMQQWIDKKLGPSQYGANENPHRLYTAFCNGKSYASLAQELNREIEFWMEDYIWGNPEWGTDENAREVLEDFKFPKEEIDRCLERVMHNLRNDLPGFDRVKNSPSGRKLDLIDGPITREHVRDCIRSWKRKNKIK